MKQSAAQTNWTPRPLRKKNRSQTPGKAKGGNCQATPLDRYMAKRNRSYKHPEYAKWCAKKTG